MKEEPYITDTTPEYKGPKYISTLIFISALCGFLFPFANIIIPLIIWVIYRDRGEQINQSGKEVLNFQITFMIYAIILVIIQIVNFVFLTQSAFALIAIAFTWFLLFALALTNTIAMIVGAVKAYGGTVLNFPYKINFIK